MNIFELAVVVSAVDRATAVLNGVKASINGAAAAAEKMKTWGQQAQVGGALMQGASQKITENLEAIMAPAREVEDALAMVQTVVTPLGGTMTQTLSRMRDAALQWSNGHTDGAAKFLNTTYMMISAGLDANASVAATTTAMQVARATMGDSKVAADMMADAYNMMGDKTKPVTDEMARLGDVITKTQQTFKFANLQQLAEGIANSQGAANVAKVPFEQLNAVLGILNNNGVKGAEAGTALKAAIAEMSKASAELGFNVAKTATGGLDLIGTLGNIEKKFGSLSNASPKLQAALRSAFTDVGYDVLTAVNGKTADLAKGLSAVEQAAGAAAAATAILDQTQSSQGAMLSNRMTALKVVVTDQLTPAFESLAGYGSTAVAAMTGFAQAHPTLIRTAGILAVVVATLTGVGGSIMLLLGSIGMFSGYVLQGASMVSTFAMSVVGLGPKIAAASAAMYQFAAGAVVRMAAALMACVPSFLAATASAWAFAAALMANPITWIVLAIVALAALIYVYWEPIKTFFVAMWEVIKSAFAGAWQYCVSAWNGAMAWFSGLWNTIKGAFDGGIMGVLGLFAKFSPLGLIVQALNAVTEWLFGFSLIDAGANILRTLTQGIRNAASGPVEAMMSVVQRVRNLLPFSPAKAGPLRDLHRVRLIETLAETVRPMPLVAAMSGAAAAAMAAIPEAALQTSTMSVRIASAPTVAALPEARRRGPGDGTDTGDGGIVVHFHIAGNADASTVAQLESWARSNSRLLYSVVKREGERDKRSDFG